MLGCYDLQIIISITRGPQKDYLNFEIETHSLGSFLQVAMVSSLLKRWKHDILKIKIDSVSTLEQHNFFLFLIVLYFFIHAS